MKNIESFSGGHRYLSNFWGVSINYDGINYPSTEHAYQASKTIDNEERLEISLCGNAGKAKRLGKRVTKRPEWKEVKLGIMYDINLQKFSNNESLKQALIETGDAEIIEGNNWKDIFWGICDGVGENHLGKILMRIRSELK